VPNHHISCPVCTLTKEVSDADIPYQRSRVACPKCGESFIFEKPPARAPTPAEVIKFPFLGHEVSITGKPLTYNRIRSTVSVRADQASAAFALWYDTELAARGDISKCHEIGREYLTSEAREAFSLAAGYGCSGLNLETFTLTYYSPYDRWDALCDEIVATYSSPDDPERRARLITGIRKGVFALHFAVADALLLEHPLEEGGDKDTSDERQREILAKLVSSSPHDRGIYDYVLSLYGDANGEITRLCDFLHIELKEVKSRLLFKFYEGLGRDTEEQLLDAKWHVKKRAAYLGIPASPEIAKDIEERLIRLDVDARKVEEHVFASRHEAAKARCELEVIRGIMAGGNTSTDKGARALLTALDWGGFETSIVDGYRERVKSILAAHEERAASLLETPSPVQVTATLPEQSPVGAEYERWTRLVAAGRWVWMIVGRLFRRRSGDES
jgi:hypothetical protein